LINIYVKEKMEDLLLLLKQSILRDYKVNQTKALTEFYNSKYYQKLFDRFGSTTCSKIGTFLSTGNIVSSTGLDLMQVSGYTIVAERLNINRYYSHFQSVHRGQFFTTMKTTTVRKLLPESWGFLCPVHTPDGSPCGLLNHLAKEAVLISFPTTEKLPTTSSGALTTRTNKKWLVGNELRQLFVSLGIVPSGISSGNGSIILSSSNYLPVLLDGVRFGGLPINRAADIVKQLRLLKLDGTLDPTMELAYIPFSPLGGAYPGLYIFTSPGRLIRPTVHLGGKQVEWIGPMEQVFMDIACIPDDITEVTTHIEINPTIMLSHVASLIPFSDYNQSPRNMYQCQMGKQTMGTPAHALRHRSDNKLYRIQNPQAPIVQTQTHRDYSMDEYPQGANAVVAVISYTGYDMEDAMIINKAAFERGFGHGSVYKTKVIDLDEEEKRLTSETGGKPILRFINLKTPPISSDDDAASMAGEKFCEHLDYDGLPYQGEVVEHGKPICCLVDTMTGRNFFINHKDDETAYVETVRVIGSSAAISGGKAAPVRRVSITFRYRRNPVIGDKFSSRHGQKGTLSVLWPQENMPFTESGLTPDVLINPHAYPSRMTIGMLIESMAGKSGSLNGIFQDATPFQFHEEDKIIDYMGQQLLSSGYQYYGSEPLYSGLSGKAMQADIFIGVVYYQRLRHMVSDKSQVRSTGPVTSLTHQPVKGRKKHGGIRLGEMERDALLSHGVSFCLHDRLMNSSDKHLAHVCANCGDLMSVYSVRPSKGSSFSSTWQSGDYQMCNICHSYQSVRPIYIPYVFRYLVNELAGMGLKIRLKLSE
jgi:DNA-directed RNA polymerase I subunit RPA2